MKRTVMVGMMAALFCASLMAQDLPMIRSEAALRAYALELTRQVYASVNTALPVGDNGYARVPVESSTAEGIINTIRQIDLSVDVANPHDYLHIAAGAYTSDGDPLFTGYHQFKLVESEGGFVLPSDYGNLTLSLYDEIPIPIRGALTAQITIQNERGETEYGTSLPVNNGKVYFPTRLTGTKALLSVYCDNGKGAWLYWNIKNGGIITPKQFAVGVTANIRGVVTVTDDDVWVPIETTNGVGENITVEFKVTSAYAYMVTFWTSEKKWFKGIWVRMAGHSEWQYHPAVAFEDLAILGVMLNIHVPGVYYIIPAWNDGDLIELPDSGYPPYGSGGGGGGKG